MLARVVSISFLAAMIPALNGTLSYDRALVAGGQCWRLFTGHLAHDSLRHFAYDALAMTTLGIACERQRRGAALLAIALSSGVISLILLPLCADVSSYRGLSALATALYSCVLGAMFFDGRSRNDARRVALAASLFLGFVFKTLYEAVAGVPLFAPDPGVEPWPIAHLFGAAAGLIASLPSPSRAIAPPLHQDLQPQRS